MTPRLLALALPLALLAGPAAASEDRKPPYFASINAGDAMMRTGPDRKYPAVWRYRRADLPVKVVETYPSWRRVEDPGGERGWMLQRLLSDTRTAIVTGTELRAMHEAATDRSRILYRARPGVVGRISKCGDGWCRLDVTGREGFIEVDFLWGVSPGERID